jgi:hypothetical protein
MPTAIRTLALGAALLAVLVGCTAPPSPDPDAPPTLDEYLAQWDEYEPFEASGSGNAVIDIPPGIASGMVTASHRGSGVFRIFMANDSGQNFELLTRAGHYDGVVEWGLNIQADENRAVITADGSWTFRLEPLSNAPQIELPADGTTDAVYRYDGDDPAIDDGILVVSEQEGDIPSHFSFMQSYGSSDGIRRVELFVNGMAGTEDPIDLEPGPSIFVVTASTPWRITAGD